MPSLPREILEALSRLKKSVDEHEKLLDITKTVLNEVRAFGDSERIDVLLDQIIMLYKELQEIGDILASHTYTVDESTRNYIETLIQYILLVSIPYEKDLLNDIRNLYMKSSKTDRVKRINETINLIVETNRKLELVLQST